MNSCLLILKIISNNPKIIGIDEITNKCANIKENMLASFLDDFLYKNQNNKNNGNIKISLTPYFCNGYQNL